MDAAMDSTLSPFKETTWIYLTSVLALLLQMKSSNKACIRIFGRFRQTKVRLFRWKAARSSWRVPTTTSVLPLIPK